MKTPYETIDLPHGYKAEIHLDDSPMNPFDLWDCEPPIAVWNLDNRRGHLDNYKGAELSLGVLLDALPSDKWETRTGKREILNAIGLDAFDIAQDLNYRRDSFRETVEAAAGEIEPSGWSCAQEYFERMRAVAALAGIPCHYTISRGYSQGDSALVFVAATPEWVAKVGAGGDMATQCEATCDLWGAWAWGDVYGAVVVDPKGEETEESCWGFYGDHDSSGLREYAENAAECHRAARRADLLKRRAAAKVERKESFLAACRDIATA